MKNKENNLTDGMMEAISVLKSGNVPKKKSVDNGEVNLISIAEKVARNRKKEEKK